MVNHLDTVETGHSMRTPSMCSCSLASSFPGLQKAVLGTRLRIHRVSISWTTGHETTIWQVSEIWRVISAERSYASWWGRSVTLWIRSWSANICCSYVVCISATIYCSGLEFAGNLPEFPLLILCGDGAGGSICKLANSSGGWGVWLAGHKSRPSVGKFILTTSFNIIM